MRFSVPIRRHPISRFLACTLLVASVFLSPPTQGAAVAAKLPPFDPATVPAAPDYTNKSTWLCRPAQPNRYAVDVFWVYPTVLHDDTHWLMPATDKAALAAARGTLASEAAVFCQQANCYAPVYRQMNMAALTLTPDKRETLLRYGRDDVRRALRHYLKYDNHGRPFILAGHSQGSNVLLDILVDAWGTLGAEKRLVAGYLIGWSITADDLARNPALKICRTPGETRCLVSYNTVAPGRQAAAPTMRPGSIAVNPLSWRTDGTKVPASANLGAVIFDPKDGTGRFLPHFTGAQVRDGAVEVVVTDPDINRTAASHFPKGVYHKFDFSFFFENLKANAAERIQRALTQERPSRATAKREASPVRP